MIIKVKGFWKSFDFPDQLANECLDVMEYVFSITSPEGGFYSAEDADSIIQHGKPEHAEGAFYVFTYQEIINVLEEADAKGDLSLLSLHLMLI